MLQKLRNHLPARIRKDCQEFVLRLRHKNQRPIHVCALALAIGPTLYDISPMLLFVAPVILIALIVLYL